MSESSNQRREGHYWDHVWVQTADLAFDADGGYRMLRLRSTRRNATELHKERGYAVGISKIHTEWRQEFQLAEKVLECFWTVSRRAFSRRSLRKLAETLPVGSTSPVSFSTVKPASETFETGEAISGLRCVNVSWLQGVEEPRTHLHLLDDLASGCCCRLCFCLLGLCLFLFA